MARQYYPSEDTFLNASRGLIRGGEVRNIFGNALDTDSVVATEYRTPWELADDYEFPTAAVPMTVASDIGTTADDGVQVLIKGLDADWNYKQEVATINNASPFVTSAFLRINDVIEVSGNATGNITVSNSAVVYAKILAGAGRDQKAVFSVPANHCFYLYRIDAFATDSNGGKAAFFRNYVKNNITGTEFRVAETQFFENMNIVRRFPFKYEQKSDIKLQLKASIGSIDGSLFAEGLLLREPISNS